MRNVRGALLMAGALVLLALSSTGCTVIGTVIGLSLDRTKVDVVLDDGSKLRCEYATLDTSEVRTDGAVVPGARTGRRELTVRTGYARESVRLPLDGVRRIVGSHGVLALVLDDGTQVHGRLAEVDPGDSASDSASARPDDIRPAHPQSLLLAQKVRGDPVLSMNAWGASQRTVPTRWESTRADGSRARGQAVAWPPESPVGIGAGAAMDAAFIAAAALTWNQVSTR